eukprot:CAMPEP_0175101980 /NCGR_PEP_ID=MMETSP0086_2-20121207/8151_1 /TAXON_ID=136419 /ORGANISM="Unknown Unknown, Strain D1" /LENGTH=476 /DNA_ID=CAMNT_0016376677 /DNA_START=40 /DNA_END=1470 /DNA_ORIENTATION=-
MATKPKLNWGDCDESPQDSPAFRPAENPAAPSDFPPLGAAGPAKGQAPASESGYAGGGDRRDDRRDDYNDRRGEGGRGYDDRRDDRRGGGRGYDNDRRGGGRGYDDDRRGGGRDYDDDRRGGGGDRRGGYDDHRGRGSYDDRRDDRRGGGGRREDERRDEPLVLPNEPPFTAFVGNLDFRATEDDVADFFHMCKIDDIRLPRRDGQSRGYCHVEFVDKESLEIAMEAHGVSWKGRQLRVDLVREKRRDDRRGGFGSRGGPPSRSDEADVWTRGKAPERPARQNDRGDRGDRRGPRSYGTGNPIRDKELEEQNKPKERKKLNLAPRSVEVKDASSPSAAASSPKADPFGGAKPRELVLADRPEDVKARFARDDKVRGERSASFRGRGGRGGGRNGARSRGSDDSGAVEPPERRSFGRGGSIAGRGSGSKQERGNPSSNDKKGKDKPAPAKKKPAVVEEAQPAKISNPFAALDLDDDE